MYDFYPLRLLNNFIALIEIWRCKRDQSSWGKKTSSFWGKFKLAKQQLSSIHPAVLLFHSKD